jgi:class 3 adenylate cyclase
VKQEIQTLTLLFADISKSSHIYEVLGDQKAQDLIGGILTRLTEIAIQFSGKVVKTVGDSIICIFHSTDNAVEAAKSMQLMVIQWTSVAPNMSPVNIHIGIHHGSVVSKNNEVFGEAMNIAARVTDYAKPRQIVATRQVVDQLSRHSCRCEKYLSKITAKNISGEIELFEIVFESQQTTMVLDSRKLADAICSCLHLIKDGQEIIVDVQRPVISIGREDFNDIVIKYSWISRTHAYIENRSGAFIVNDKSTNGTYIYPSDSEPIYINKGEHRLVGKGVILLGRDTQTDVNHMNHQSSDTVEYIIK